MAEVRRAEGVLVDRDDPVGRLEEDLGDRTDAAADLQDPSPQVRRRQADDPAGIPARLGHPPKVVERVDDIAPGDRYRRHGGEDIIGLMGALTRRIEALLAQPGGPAAFVAALEALPSVRGEGRGAGEALELLAIDGALTRRLAEAPGEADEVLSALERAAGGSR